MTPKEKAQQLVNSFYYALPNNGRRTGLNSTTIRYKEAIKCALIAVDEILSSFTALSYGVVYLGQIDYWQEVKEEIEIKRDEQRPKFQKNCNNPNNFTKDETTE